LKAKNAYAVLRLARRIALRYGHKVNDAITLTVAELVEDADMSNAVHL
jgi:predicted nucleic acid-binding protein